MNTRSQFFQDYIQDNHCFGCSPDNKMGLQIKSYWTGEDKAECRFTPAAHHCAGPETFINGGIISTLIDCHCVCTAIAKAYQIEGRAIDEGDNIRFVTGSLAVSYKAPTPIDQDVLLKARITEVKNKKISLHCTVHSGEQICAEGDVMAIRVPDHWG